MDAQRRGELDSAEDWYRQSLAINEQLDNRPGMALTYAQLGLLAEERESPADAFHWSIRAIVLFDMFPHPSTGTAPGQLVRLTARHGEQQLNQAWLETTGHNLPDTVERVIRAAMTSDAESDED
jgi:hypothetical protein